MLELKLLTRNFHDQMCEKVEFVNNELTVYISAYECGDKYYCDGLCENRNMNENSSGILRDLKIKFYNIKNINPEFDFDFEDSLDIYELIIKQNYVEFRLYYENGSLNLLFFDCKLKWNDLLSVSIQSPYFSTTSVFK